MGGIRYKPRRDIDGFRAGFRQASQDDDANPIFLFMVNTMLKRGGGVQPVLYSTLNQGVSVFRIKVKPVVYTSLDYRDENDQNQSIEVAKYFAEQWPPREDDEEEYEIYDVGYDKFCENVPTLWSQEVTTYEYEQYAFETVVTCSYEPRTDAYIITSPIATANIACEDGPLQFDCGS